MTSQMKLHLMLLLVAAVMTVMEAQQFTFSSPTPTPMTQQTLQQVAATLQLYVDPLPQMPIVYGFSTEGGNPVSTNLTIGMYPTNWKFHRDLPATPVFVYGTSAETATFPGPTIIARHGIPLYVKWENHLPDLHVLPTDNTISVANSTMGGVPTVVHLHGSVHPPQSDGSAFAWFTRDYKEVGPKWTQTTYMYPNIQPAGNLWYHDHALGLTRVNLLAGLLGAYIIEKPEVDDPMDLPSGEDDDLHLIIADRSFNTDGTLYMNSTGNVPSIHPQWQPEYFGEVITVNGKAWPFLNVARRRYRFRILNASNARYLNLSLSNGLPFYVIGSDASYLAAPVETQTILLSPAELADVVIDFSNSTTPCAEILNSAPYPYPTGSATTGTLLSKVMIFHINDTKVFDNSTIPDKEVNYANVTMPEPSTTTRYIVMYEYTTPSGGVTHLYINGLRLEDPVTETPKAGATELWHVVNLTPDNHPLHVHLGMMQAINVTEIVGYQQFFDCMTQLNDAIKCNVTDHAIGKTLPIPEYEKTWKNVVKIEPHYMTSVVVAFKIVDTNQSYPFDSTAEPGYVYHCHILDHEDNAMIRPLKFLS
ncbi:Multicopper oxidase LPR1 [Rhynchospora pubera]|uniref:Multicopper oxidase LPR1 n=1 Tax=Rhynchospora pubera TaxID=906938 RepID=A0AAV8C0Q7_9POAL|nr:Multicopper oxidase LPR1 [Rhynchospora pubera]